MQILRELADFLRQHRIYQSKTLLSKNWKRDKSDEFLEKIQQDEFHSEEELATYFYRKKDRRYTALKGRFYDNMIASILLVDFKNQRMHPFSRKYYTIVRELAAAKILLGKTFPNAAIYIANRCLKRAYEIGFYDLVYDAIRVLKNHYGVRLKKEAKFIEYDEKLKAARAVLDLEDRSYTNYAKVLIAYKKDRSDLSKCHSVAKTCFEELEPYLDTCPSIRFQLTTRLIRNIVNATSYDFQIIIDDSSKDIQFLLEKYNGYTTNLSVFLFQKTIACVRLGRYEEGLRTINQTLSFLDDRNINWFSARYYQFFIYMQSGQYAAARDVYNQTTKHRRYKSTMPAVKEDWEVGGAYLAYVIEKGLLDTEKKIRFSAGKLLNSVPEYSKDKRVKNIPILVIQILFRIQRRQTNQAIESIAAIEQYCGRNLSYNEAVRSNAFIKMLQEISKNSFRKNAVLRKVTRYVKKLSDVPIHQSGKNFDLEIIPYEKLWEFAISGLR
ncbi:MAG: hypothetical protein AAGI23_09500 [Bacteroidota bacterium]